MKNLIKPIGNLGDLNLDIEKEIISLLINDFGDRIQLSESKNGTENLVYILDGGGYLVIDFYKNFSFTYNTNREVNFPFSTPQPKLNKINIYNKTKVTRYFNYFNKLDLRVNYYNDLVLTKRKEIIQEKEGIGFIKYSSKNILGYVGELIKINRYSVDTIKINQDIVYNNGYDFEVNVYPNKRTQILGSLKIENLIEYLENDILITPKEIFGKMDSVVDDIDIKEIYTQVLDYLPKDSLLRLKVDGKYIEVNGRNIYLVDKNPYNVGVKLNWEWYFTIRNAVKKALIERAKKLD